MTTRNYMATLDCAVVALCGKGHDEPARRANAIATLRELWPESQLIRLVPAGDW